jgi:formyltetrahydrofolate-dependent phosphoribosylglycinamide formyltransferase
VVSDRPCRGLDIATEAGIDAVLLDRGTYGGFASTFDREGYSDALAALLQEHAIGLVAMAGFGTILSASVHHAFPGRILNTHPSLLPKYKGWHAVADAFEAGEAVTGCTVHVATEILDEGPILAQGPVEIRGGDSVESLHERIKERERRLYPIVITGVLATMVQGNEPSTYHYEGKGH